MKNSILIILLLFVCQLSFCQRIVYKNRGNIEDINGNNLSPNEVRSLLATNEKLLAEYNNGREKKTLGNVLLLGGATVAFVPTVSQLYNGEPVSTGLFAAGTVLMLVSIPMLNGYTKKIKNVVSEYNNKKIVGATNFRIQRTDFIANSNGLGFRLAFN